MSRHSTIRAVSLGTSALFLAPFIVFAAATTIQGLIGIIVGILRLLVPVVIALALLYFFWGLAKFILRADDEAEREKGKQIMLWGIIALFVILTIWGIIAVLQTTFVRPATTIPLPTLPSG